MTSLFSNLQKYSEVLGAVAGFPKRIGSLPMQPLNLLNQAKSYLGMREEELKIGLFIDPLLSDENIELLIQLFEPNSEKARVLVHVLSEEMSLGEHVSYNANVFALRNTELRFSIVGQSSEQDLPTLLVVEEGLRREAAEAFDMSILDVASARKPELLATQVSTWFADNLNEHRMALAADFVFMRPALANVTVNATARQNAIIAAVFFLPGADLPVMTLNQIKMVLQLAIMHGEDLTWKRVVEAAIVVLCAYGARAAARAATSDMPRFFSWPVKIAVAYASTVAVGRGAQLWLLNAPNIPSLDEPLPDLRELAAKTPLANTPLMRFLPPSEPEYHTVEKAE